MPEGHSILRASRLWNTMRGASLQISSPQGRFTEEALALDGLPLLNAEPYGKHLFLHFGSEKIVHIHLALYGRHYVFENPPPQPRPTVRLRIVGENKTIDLVGPAVCKLLDKEAYEKVLARLGPDPLKLEEAPEEFISRMAKSKKPIGQVLMDQTLIVGIGNVYRAELLFFLAMDPWKPANELTRDEWQKLWRMARELLETGSRLKGRTLTLIPELSLPKTMKGPAPLATEERFSYAYAATDKPCLACGTKIKGELFYGRTLYYCPRCQA